MMTELRNSADRFESFIDFKSLLLSNNFEWKTKSKGELDDIIITRRCNVLKINFQHLIKENLILLHL